MYGMDWAENWGWMVMGMGMMGIFGFGLLASGWKAISQSSGGTRTSDSPGEILKRRLARGEITSDEYGRLDEELRR